MRKQSVSRAIPLIILALVILVGGLVSCAQDEIGALARKQRFSHVYTKKLTVENETVLRGDITQTGDQTITGDFTVTGDTTLGDAAGDTVTVTGDQVIDGSRDATTGRDYFLKISGDVTGAGANAKTYGLFIDMERTAANTHGNIDDAGVQIRSKTSATSRVAGIVQNGIDVESKTDDGHHAGTIRGAQITAVSDASATTDAQIALRAHAEVATGATATALQVADFELNRKSAVEPTTEYGVNLRNTSSAGTGADVGYRLESSYGAGGSSANADWVYGLDMANADIVTADIRLSNGETIKNTTDYVIDIGGNVVVTGAADADANNYDYFMTIEGLMTGTGTKDRNFGLLIDMTREAGQELVSGDHTEAGLKIAVDTEATSTTSGTTLRAINAEAKADNPGGTVTNLYGSSITAKSDTGAGSVDSMIAATFHANNNAAVVNELMVADFNLYRQAATVPTEEFGIRVRSTSSTGSGADAAVYVESDWAGSATTDSWDYGLDLSGAAINTADIRLENGETISNGTDTAVQVGGFLALTEGTTFDLANGGIITPTASYQPLTVSGAAHATTDTTWAIANGPVAGSLLVLCNEDATYNVVVKDGANTKLSGDLTLTAGNDDCLTLIWNGADWVGLSDMDN